MTEEYAAFKRAELERWYDGECADRVAEARRATMERFRAMRQDYQTMPHAEFPVKWPDWKEWEDALPTSCGCQDCQLWRSGS